MSHRIPVGTLRAILALAVLGSSGAQGSAAQDFDECGRTLEGEAASEAPYRCIYEFGLSTGREDDASAHLEALSLQHPEAGWPRFYLGLSHWSQPELGEVWLDRAAARFAEAGDLRGEVLARGNREHLLYTLGRLAEAGREAELAAQIGEASGDEELTARGRIYLGRHLLRSSYGLEDAFRILSQVEAELSPQLPYSITHHCLVNLGTVAIELGRLEDAASAYRRLLSQAEGIGNLSSQAEAWYGLTRVAAERFADAPASDRRAEVLELAGRTVEVAKRAHHPSAEALGHWMLGVLSSKGSRENLERCSELASTPREKGYCLNALARRLAESDSSAAGQVIEQALKLAQAAGDPFSAAFAWSERMRVTWLTESTAVAIEDSWTALDRIEALRDLQTDGSEVQAGLFSTWADDYHWFAGRLLEEVRATGRDEFLAEAFAVSERLRARALTDWLRAAGKGGDGPATWSALREHGSEFASLAEVQLALGPREALLAFQVAPWEDLAGDFGGGSWLIAVTRRHVRAYPLPGRREIRQAVDLYTGLFEQRDGSEAAPSAHLFRQLLAPALEELPNGVDRLILVPDDALHRLPFGALRQAPEAPPLATTHRISVAPSASLWLGWRRGAPEAKLAGHADGSGAAALVLAAPVVDGSVSGGRGSGASVAAGLPPLVHARREGHAIAAVLGRRTELARGAAASEALLAGADLSRFGILHLAAHAVTDEAHPERSAVILAPGDLEAETRNGPSAGGRPEAGPAAEDGSETGPAPAGSAQDGLLRAGEIAALDLDGKLVVLSSCRSASGTVLRGEGVMSLGRAFFQAGARTVVASLWPVRDDEAAALFEEFYRHLARGETVAAALQAAQSDRIAAGAPASAWAAFTVLGDGDLAPVSVPVAPARDIRLAFAGAAVALLALLAAGGWLARHRVAALLASRRSGRHRPSDLATAPSSTR